MKQISNSNKRTYKPLTEKELKSVMNEMTYGPIPRNPKTGRFMKRQPRKRQKEYTILAGPVFMEQFNKAMEDYGKK